MLEADHPTSIIFLDESGAIAQDRFFAVGCLKLSDPPTFLRQLQKLRDVWHWYKEIHWVELTRLALPFYTEVATIASGFEGARFSCIVADRRQADPVQKLGSPWAAYEHLSTELLLKSIEDDELATVLADNYSTPDDVWLEHDIKKNVNDRLGRLAVTTVCRLDSKTSDALQVVDLLTAAVTFEFRQEAGLAGHSSPKAELAEKIRDMYGMGSVLKGVPSTNRVHVSIYSDSD